MMQKIPNTSLSFLKKKPQKRGIDGAHNEPWYAEQNSSSSQKRWQKIDPKELCKGTVN